MTTFVQVRGNDSLKRKLNQLATGVQGETLEGALAAGAVLIQNSAKRYAPKHEGTLARSIHIGGHEELAGDYDGNYPRAKDTMPDPAGSDMERTLHVGTDIIYGAQKEFGGTITAKNAPRLVWQDYSGNWHSAVSVYQEAQPYMRPAIDENLGPLYRKIGDELTKAIKRAATGV